MPNLQVVGRTNRKGRIEQQRLIQRKVRDGLQKGFDDGENPCNKQTRCRKGAYKEPEHIKNRPRV